MQPKPETDLKAGLEFTERLMLCLYEQKKGKTSSPLK
jgi:hypothetical protein